MKKIWVYGEEVQGEISKVSLELLTKANELKESFKEDTEIGVVLLTANSGGIEEKVKVLESYGATKLYVGEDDIFKDYSHTSYAPVIADLIRKEDPDIFLFGASQTGSELAPTVAAIVKTGIAAHCVDLRICDEGRLVSDVPAFGGKIIGEILIPECRPQMASVKPGIFTAKGGCQTKAVIEKIDLQALKNTDKRLVPLGTFVSKPRTKPIDEAEIVLVGGYGLGNKENWDKLEELAELLGGAVGSTRPSLDEGWTEDEQTMIGTSGKSIKPKVYVGFGISGATHHVCGMKDSDLVISINSDKNSDIFGVSDYCAVSDVNELIPVLMDLVRSQKDKTQ